DPTQNVPDSAASLLHERDWPDFIGNGIPMLEHHGWRVELSDDFPLQPLGDGEIDLDIEEGEDWFDLALGIEVDGERVNLLPLLLEALASLPPKARLPEALGDEDVFTLP